MVVEMYAFRGSGNFKKAAQQNGGDARYGTGHVGISFDNGRTIYGFNPAIGNLSLDDVFSHFLNGLDFDGLLIDDTAVFSQAIKLGMNIVRTILTTDANIYKNAYRDLADDFNNSPLAYKRYAFPRKRTDPLVPTRGLFNPNCYNCATYPESIKLPTSYPSGILGEYLPR